MLANPMNPFSVLTVATLVVKTTVLLVAALLATKALHRAPAGARYVVWLATLVAVLVFPVLSSWAPLKLAVLPSGLAEVGTLAPTVYNPSIATDAVEPRSSAPQPVSGRAPSASTSGPLASNDPALRTPNTSASGAEHSAEGTWLRVGTLLIALWAAVAVALLGWLVAGAVLVHRIVRGGRVLDSSAWTVPLVEVADRLDLEATPRLVASTRIEMPFACGFVHPTIVLPASAEDWTDERRRLVLLHELAHVRRRDLLGHGVSRIACALYWFNPLVWAAAKGLRAESERACDDLVVQCGARATDYANHLLEMVTAVRGHATPAMAMPMARRKEFEGRMLAILDPALHRDPPGRLQSLTVTIGLFALSLSVAAMVPAPRPAAAASARPTPPVTAESRRGESTYFSVRAPAGAEKRTAGRAAELRPRAPDSPVEQVVPLVMSTITAPNPGRQAIAASDDPAKASPAGDSGRVALLIRVLRSDSSVSVRRTAAWGLGPARRNADATDALIKALRGDADERVREMAAWALAERQSQTVTSALADALRGDRSVEVRETAAWALGERGENGDPAALAAALRDADADVRGTAAWALGHIGVDQAPAALVNAVGDSDSGVRLKAAWALGQIRDSVAGPALAMAFAKEADGQARRAELYAIANIGERSEAVADRALASTDPELRKLAIRMLAGQSTGPWPWPWPRPRPSP